MTLNLKNVISRLHGHTHLPPRTMVFHPDLPRDQQSARAVATSEEDLSPPADMPGNADADVLLQRLRNAGY